MKHVIIGASAAGVSAAKTLRTLNSQDEIIVVSADSQVHSRCMLHHLLGHEKTPKAINFTKEDFFEINNITLRANTKVSAIETARNRLILENGETISYDKLLIATGAKAFVPPIPHFREAKNVHVFRDMPDALALDKLAAKGKSCVIVGSGLVGLDAAYALCERNVTCHVAEISDRICPLQLDHVAAAAYQKHFEQHGCVFHLSDGVESAQADESGNITAIVMKSGDIIPCDFVVVSAGVRPNLDILAGTGITTDKGIVVNDCLGTNIENIWAAGDVTAIAGIWSSAVLQGEVAARNMLGESVCYDDRFAFKNTMNFYGLTTLSVGYDDGQGDAEIIIRESRNRYEKYILRNDVLTFALIQGDISNTGVLQEIIKKKIPVGHLGKLPSKLSFADFYNVDAENGQFEWAVK